jgi:receptor protein-tyrosine kinase
VELRDYLNIARRRWLAILGCTAAVLAVAAGITAQAQPQYASTAQLFVSTTPTDTTQAYQGGMFSQQRVKSYSDMVTGLELAARVIDNNDVDLAPSELSSKISAAVVPDTVLLTITVTDPSAAQARWLNEAVVDEFRKFVGEIETPPGSSTPLIKATIVDPPRLPASPVSPRPLRNLLLGGVLGLLLGFGLAMTRELLDASVKDIGDVPALADVPVLSTLALDSEVTRQPLISSLASHAPRVEAFRVLRTNLQFIDVDSKSKAFVVTSAVPGEGKSTTAVNAALALAQVGRRVLLLDSDMRRPQVARLLGLETSVGLTTLLLGTVKLDDALQTHAASGLQVLASGAIPPNPAELLQSQAMNDLLIELRARFDVIIIDAPPLLPVTDAALLASKTDGAIIVTRHSKTTRDQLTTAVDRLTSVDAHVLGLVFNMVPVKRSSGAYGYGYGYAPHEQGGEQSRWRRKQTTTADDELRESHPAT